MYDSIQYILQRECKLDTNNPVMLGVSGGPDSLCLLHIMHSLGYKIIVAHVNHGLRSEADEEEKWVEQTAGKLGADFISQKVNVLAYAEEHSLSIEEAARMVRYEYLFQQAEARTAEAVVVGHSADDQVETILMHLVRGSGLAGLRGMDVRACPNAWSEKIPLVRPLLRTWRSEILDYLNERGLQPLMDHTNLDKVFFRNRLRLELLPLLESYNPRIRQVLLRTSQSLTDDFAFLQSSTQAAMENLTQNHAAGFPTYDLSGFHDLPISIQRLFLRKAIALHRPGLRDVDFDCVERGIKLLAGGKLHGKMELLDGLSLIFDGDTFWITLSQADLTSADYPSITAGMEIALEIPSSLNLSNDWQLVAEYSADKDLSHDSFQNNQDPFQVWMDISYLRQPLILRARHKGDKIRLLGLNGHSMKISDLMINLKLAVRRRDTWPLLCTAQEVVWVPGYRMSTLVQVKPSSERIIHLWLRRRSTA